MSQSWLGVDPVEVAGESLDNGLPALDESNLRIIGLTPSVRPSNENRPDLLAWPTPFAWPQPVSARIRKIVGR